MAARQCTDHASIRRLWLALNCSFTTSKFLSCSGCYIAVGDCIFTVSCRFAKTLLIIFIVLVAASFVHCVQPGPGSETGFSTCLSFRKPYFFGAKHVARAEKHTNIRLFYITDYILVIGNTIIYTRQIFYRESTLEH